MKNVQIQIIAQSEAYYLPRFPSGNIESACRLPLNACPMDCMQAHTNGAITLGPCRCMHVRKWANTLGDAQVRNWAMPPGGLRVRNYAQVRNWAMPSATAKVETEQCHRKMRKSNLPQWHQEMRGWTRAMTLGDRKRETEQCHREAYMYKT